MCCRSARYCGRWVAAAGCRWGPRTWWVMRTWHWVQRCSTLTGMAADPAPRADEATVATGRGLEQRHQERAILGRGAEQPPTPLSVAKRRAHARTCVRTAAPLELYCPCFFFQAEDGIRGDLVTGVQTCALPI